jgi:hypothetical protein
MTRWNLGLEAGPLRKQIPYGLMDLLVIAACCMAFAAVIVAAKSISPKGPSNVLIAPNPGPPPYRPSAEDHKRLVATALGIFAEPLDSVLE